MNPGPRIHLTGATGRTGNAVAHALSTRRDVDLVTCVAPSLGRVPTRPVPSSCLHTNRVDAIPADHVRHGDVLVELSIAERVAGHLQWALDHGVHVVVGTTGCNESMLEEAGARFHEAGLALLVIPNFSIGAVLMMRLSAEIAQYMPHVEIVETHHDTKVDAPSGTAIRTARLIAAARGMDTPFDDGQRDQARGLEIDGVPVHSLRIAGATAHQDVVFGLPGEMLTIRHDAIDRSCYGAGVALAARSVASFTGLHTGLEELL